MTKEHMIHLTRKGQSQHTTRLLPSIDNPAKSSRQSLIFEIFLKMDFSLSKHSCFAINVHTWRQTNPFFKIKRDIFLMRPLFRDVPVF